MSSDLEEAFTCIFEARVPPLWEKAYSSLKPLGRVENKISNFRNFNLSNFFPNFYKLHGHVIYSRAWINLPNGPRPPTHHTFSGSLVSLSQPVFSPRFCNFPLVKMQFRSIPLVGNLASSPLTTTTSSIHHKMAYTFEDSF